MHSLQEKTILNKHVSGLLCERTTGDGVTEALWTNILDSVDSHSMQIIHW